MEGQLRSTLVDLDDKSKKAPNEKTKKELIEMASKVSERLRNIDIAKRESKVSKSKVKCRGFNISDNNLEVLKELRKLLALNFQGSDSERKQIKALVETLHSRGTISYYDYYDIMEKLK